MAGADHDSATECLVTAQRLGVTPDPILIAALGQDAASRIEVAAAEFAAAEAEEFRLIAEYAAALDAENVPAYDENVPADDDDVSADDDDVPAGDYDAPADDDDVLADDNSVTAVDTDSWDALLLVEDDINDSL